ncbi:MAG: hypothetical protein ABIO79_08710 [Ferruginibacter sp.]
MEHFYTVHTKIIDDKTYYFVKKIMSLPEFKGLPDVVVGYGMHNIFEKACNIAGLHDKATRQQLLQQLVERNKVHIPEKRHTVQITDVNRWFAKLGAEVLN